MKIGIAGYGFVGQAYEKLLKDKHNIVISDPAYPEHSRRIPKDVDAIIICVATPARKDGSCEMENVFNVIEYVPDIPILIKSTISIEGWQMLVDAFPKKRISFSPEFLRAETALDDLRTSKLMLIGGKETNFWKNVFEVNLEVTDPEHLILAKYARNSFLALKVAYFNQLYDLCKQLGIDYGAVAHYTVIDPRIGDSHTRVTKERGYGGHCFPKDVRALIKTAQRNNVELTMLQEAVEYNNRIRKS